MEPAAPWVPYDFQLANWTMEPAGWAPGFPVESTWTEICGSYLHTYFPSSTGGQLIHQYPAATQGYSTVKVAHEIQADSRNNETNGQKPPMAVFKNAKKEFEIDVDKPDMRIHRYPPSILALGKQYTTPTMVAIGPYHHEEDRLKPVERVKHVAAYQCLIESGRSPGQIYKAVISAANRCQARRLYDKEALAGMSDNDDFFPMMFYDACFLVQYMFSLTKKGNEVALCLRNFFDSNGLHIFHDLMLLENQIPWPVVKAVMDCRSVKLEEVVNVLKGCLQDKKDLKKEVAFHHDYEPPHFLGLLRHYIVGKTKSKLPKLTPEDESISFSASAVELAEVGIKLATNKTGDLIDMGVKEKGPIFGKLYMAPLSLDEGRASYLINMAALELCTTPSFQADDDEDSGVCSYLLLLAMLVDRVEDVQKLRSKGILQGGGGLTDNDVVTLLGRLQNLRLGSSYFRTCMDIEKYRTQRPIVTWSYAFYYRNRKTISIIGSVVGGFGTIATLYSKFR